MSPVDTRPSGESRSDEAEVELEPPLTLEPVEITSALLAVEMHEAPTGADNVETGVECVTDMTDNQDGDIWYTLQGIRVERLSMPGIYIRNGRKTVVRRSGENQSAEASGARCAGGFFSSGTGTP